MPIFVMLLDYFFVIHDGELVKIFGVMTVRFLISTGLYAQKARNNSVLNQNRWRKLLLAKVSTNFDGFQNEEFQRIY